MDEYRTWADAWQPDNETAIRYGCIRISAGTHDTSDPTYIRNPGLYLLNDSNHISCGLDPDVKIDVATGHLRISAPDTDNGVVLLTGDETAAIKGLLFGASGGNGFINVRAWRSGYGELSWASQADYDLIRSSTLNLWVAFLTPLVRGSGQPSKADQALTALAALEARVAALETP